MVRGRLAVLLACCMLLSGCTAMLNRPYEVVTPHEYHAGQGSGVPDASTYQALVNDIFSFVEDGVEQGQIRLTNYTSKTGDVAGDLSAACSEVANEDPLGAYAVDFIKSDYTRVVKYYEVTITISYKRSPEQIKALVNVTGSSAIREELREVLRNFQSEAALRVSYFSEDQDYIASLIREAYSDTPEAALGMPEFTITLYPKQASSGPRIVEILLTYPEDVQTLRTRSQTLQHQAISLLTESYSTTGGWTPSTIVQLVHKQAVYEATGGSSAYDALINGVADSEGIALACLLLAQQAELEAALVQGTLEDVPHMWVIAQQADGSWRHMDATRADAVLYTDSQMSELGYEWDREEYPACEEPAR